MATEETIRNRIHIAQALLALAALGALAAALSDISTVVRAPASTAVVETWRLCGFVTFTGIFALLAARPTGYRGLWELAVANKLMLTAIALGYAAHGHIPGAGSVIGWDGSLSLLLIAAYALCRGWRKNAVGDRPQPAGVPDNWATTAATTAAGARTGSM